MSKRSYKAAKHHIASVQDSFRRSGFASQQALATEVGISVSTLKIFLKGGGIDRLNFIECCEKLGLDWQEVVEKPSKTENNPDFVGREAAITTLNELSRGAKVILLQGAGGVGKTTLARNYLAAKFGDEIIEFPIAKETEDISPVEGLLEQSLRSLGEEPGLDFGVSLLRLKEKLQTQAMGVLIDNLEPALDRTGRLIEGHRRYSELLRVLADPTVKSITLITSREALGENLDISLYRLPNLTLEAWQTYFQNRKIFCHIQEIEAIWNAYQGNALAMKLLSERVLLDHSGNVAAFWQEQQKMGVLLTMDNLIKEQFDRLKKIDLNAYHLLCRMGCFRYQDVPTVPLEGLFCLLWDVAENQRGQVVNALKNRSLVDVIDGEYQLHPLIREEAISRLKSSEDWEQTNRQAAEFWAESIKTVESFDDALQALEAYYHYLAIKDYQDAGLTLIKERSNKWEKNEHLGRSFYRLGLLNIMVSAIEKIIDKVNIIEYSLAKLYDTLGDLYWLTGRLSEAIEKHEKSGDIGQENNLTQFKMTSLLNKGLCLIDLGETNKAKECFAQVILTEREKTTKWWCLKTAYFCLAFICSVIEQKEEARMNLNNFYSIDESKGYWTSWDRGYSHLFLALTYKNLGKIDKAFEEYQEAIKFAEKSHYTQVKAKTLTGLGELYRIQKDYETALEYHLKSIEILDRIGAKCDLAEAYFQLALTYQAMGDQPKSQTYFDKALDLWGPKQIDAPKQIERVKKAMQTIPE